MESVLLEGTVLLFVRNPDDAELPFWESDEITSVFGFPPIFVLLLWEYGTHKTSINMSSKIQIQDHNSKTRKLPY